MTHEPGTIQTLLFDQNGHSTAGDHHSFYDASSSQVDLKFGTIPGQEMHVVIADGKCIVVSRCYSATQPFYVQERTVPSLTAGIDYIHSQLPKSGVTPSPFGSPQ